MIIIIGLGNPGVKFEKTPHNIGFNSIDKFAEQNSFPDFKIDKKSNSLTSENESVILVKPQTFMNESGKAVKAIIKNRSVEMLVVIHDDIDLPLGEIKIVKNRGSAGHKGVESIIESIGNENLIRIRIGVISASGKPAEPEQFVLRKFSESEQKEADKAILKATATLDILIKEGLDRAMNEHNG